MTSESRLSEFAATEQRVSEAVAMIVQQVLLTTLGTAVAGAGEDGCVERLRLVEAWGGRPDATVMVRGTRLPAPHAALVNGVVGRATVELMGGCTGQELMLALAVGTEVGARMNPSEEAAQEGEALADAGRLTALSVVGTQAAFETPARQRELA